METWQIIFYCVGGGLWLIFTALGIAKKVKAKRYYKAVKGKQGSGATIEAVNTFREMNEK